MDTGAGLVFTILRGGTISSTVHLGDMTSAVFNGVETLAPYSATARYSHYEQGLGNAVVTATVDPAGQWIKITADDSAETSGGVIQYYVAKKNDPNIYMASLPTDVNNGPGEGRYIAYMNRSVFTNIEEPSDISANTGAIEGSDVYGNADGTTASKFYDMNRMMIDNSIHGITGTNIGAFMTMGNRETSSGGPFFKDIDFQTTSAATEMYNCLFTGHTQTEAYRQGLKGPYAMMFTTGATPALPDYSFLEGVGIRGLTPASQRGTLAGTASGVPSGHQIVVGLSNGSDQYWAYANATTGAYTITGVMPGTYTETLYDTELEVGRKTVTVAAAATTPSNITDSFYIPAAPIFRIGTWDGTPLGFLNTENDATYGLPKISIMHPSDVRMDSWTSTPNFVVGANTDIQWPSVQFMGVNNSQEITFTLTAAQVQNLTLRIGITWGFSGARPDINVNSGQTYAWQSTIPAASADLNSRGITRGTWRGDNQLYTFPIPSTALRAGTNTINLPLVSGSYTSGQTWLSPNVAYDAIDLVPTTSASTPTIASVTITPTGSISASGTRAFTAVAKDSSGNVLNADFSWSATRGTIDPNGNYVAPATSGADTVSVTATLAQIPGFNTTTSSTSAFANSISSTASTAVAVLGTVPIVLTPPLASPNPAYSLTTALSVLGADDGGESALTYTWSAVGTQPGTVGFSANATNAAKNTTATFGGYGTYNLLVTIKDASNNAVTAPVSVAVKQYVAHYLADETAGPTLHDSSPSSNDGTLAGSYSFVAGESGNAVNLAGGTGGGYATLPAGLVSTATSTTVAAWINMSTVTDWMRVFDFGSGTSVYMFLTPQYGTNGYVRFAIKNGSAAEQDINSTTKITAGVWTHVAVTLSGSTGILYVNGVQVGSSSTLSINPSQLGSTTLNYIGKSQFAADPLFAGSIDDFRIYGRALSAAEILAIKNNPALPAAPATLTATPAGSGQVNLAWAPVGGATKYDVYRATSASGPYTQIASGAATSYSDAGATSTDPVNGTTFYYVVTAENAGGEGPRSPQATVTALPPVPTAPSNVIVQIATSGNLSLSWTASAGAQSYTIARGAAAGGPFTTIATGVTATTYTDTGLTNGVMYYYTVTSVNPAGNSAASPAVAGTPTDLFDYQKFDESTGTSASDSSGHGFTGTLLGNGVPVGSTTTSTGLPTFSSTGKVGAHSLSLDGTDDFTQLPAGIVAGLTNVTLSAWVNLSSVTAFTRVFDFGTDTTNYMFLTPKGTTGPRFSILTAGNTTEQQVNGTAALPANTWTLLTVTINGAVGTLYVNGTQVGQNTAMTWNPTTLGTTDLNFLGKSQFSSDPYLAGKIDDFRIYSRALSSTEITSLFANTLPATPATPTATIADAQATLNWSAVSGALGYNIKRSTTSGGPYTTVGSVAGATTFTDTGLSDGVTYYYVVSATNVTGEGNNSAQLSVIPVPVVYTGTSSADNYYIRLASDGVTEQVWVGSTTGTGTPTYSALKSQLPGLTFNTAGGADSLTADFTTGNPVPGGGVAFDGGAGSTGNLLVIDGAATADTATLNAGSVVFNGAAAITYANTQSLTLNTAGGNDVVTQIAQPTAAVTFNGGTGTDTLNVNAGAYGFATDPLTLTASLAVNVASSASVSFAANSSTQHGLRPYHLASLSLAGTATAALSSAAATADRSVLVLGALSLAGSVGHWSSKLDLGNGDLIVRSTSAASVGLLSSAENQIGTGRNGSDPATGLGAWTGNGIVTGKAFADNTTTGGGVELFTLGVVRNGDLNAAGAASYATFDGQAVGSDDVLIKYTYAGDADLSGKVTANDYSLIDQGYLFHYTGWLNGDFDHSGAVTGDDYGLIDQAFLANGPALV